MTDDTPFHQRILDWYDRHGRKNLPWQTNKTPYRVWVSEIMLQQTQVATVIPYFNRFMERFPDTGSLASAHLDEVISLWAGLGYYARARNLHRAAIELQATHHGSFPDEPEKIMALPGIGRSTAGAIISLGQNRRAAILDGNVKRVLCRHAGITAWPGETATLKRLWDISEALTPGQRTSDYNQAMMDMGALLCVRKQPGCLACPVNQDCIALLTGQTDTIPVARPRRQLPRRSCYMLVMRDETDRIWLEKRPPAGIWGGLRSLPEFDTLADLQHTATRHGVTGGELTLLPVRKHVFSHFQLDFTPVMATRPRTGHEVLDPADGADWLHLKEAGGLPAPIRELLEELEAPYRRSG